MIKRFVIYFSFLTLITVTLFLQSCDDTLNQIDDSFIPEKDISFSIHLQPVFEAKCNNADCHNSQFRAGGISFSSCAEATENPLVVFPYEPGNSTMVWAIENQSGASQMPPLGYQPLTSNQIRGIKTWIAEGAKCN